MACSFKFVRDYNTLYYIRANFCSLRLSCAIVKNVPQKPCDVILSAKFVSISRFKFLARANMKSLLNGKFSRQLISIFLTLWLKNTMCGRAVFIICAGICQRLFAKSICDHSASSVIWAHGGIKLKSAQILTLSSAHSSVFASKFLISLSLIKYAKLFMLKCGFIDTCDEFVLCVLVQNRKLK